MPKITKTQKHNESTITPCIPFLIVRLAEILASVERFLENRSNAVGPNRLIFSGIFLHAVANLTNSMPLETAKNNHQLANSTNTINSIFEAGKATFLNSKMNKDQQLMWKLSDRVHVSETPTLAPTFPGKLYCAGKL